jgi:periplasmic protein TonB
MTAAGDSRKRLLQVVGAIVGIGGIIGGLAFLIASLPKDNGPPKKVIQEVRIIRPPPPPPDQPPPPPPPPEEKVDIPEPENTPEEPTPSDEPPPGENLGIDAAGEGAGDGFGLVGRPGGRDITASGGSVFAWYAGQVKNDILQQLNEQQGVRSASYNITVRLWVRSDGSVERFALANSTGVAERDRTIEKALSQIRKLQAPPASMPQPITLRIVARA